MHANSIATAKFVFVIPPPGEWFGYVSDTFSIHPQWITRRILWARAALRAWRFLDDRELIHAPGLFENLIFDNTACDDVTVFLIKRGYEIKSPVVAQDIIAMGDYEIFRMIRPKLLQRRIKIPGKLYSQRESIVIKNRAVLGALKDIRIADDLVDQYNVNFESALVRTNTIYRELLSDDRYDGLAWALRRYPAHEIGALSVRAAIKKFTVISGRTRDLLRHYGKYDEALWARLDMAQNKKLNRPK